MSNYKVVRIEEDFIAETVARTGSEQLLNKETRGFVGLYDEETNWYIPLRANLGKNKPQNAAFRTPFKTDNFHFKDPGLDFQKALYVPEFYVKEISNTLPRDQQRIIEEHLNDIKASFENYVLSTTELDKNSTAYQFSTVPFFPEGIEKISKEVETNKLNEQYQQYLNNGGLDR